MSRTPKKLSLSPMASTRVSRKTKVRRELGLLAKTEGPTESRLSSCKTLLELNQVRRLVDAGEEPVDALLSVLIALVEEYDRSQTAHGRQADKIVTRADLLRAALPFEKRGQSLNLTHRILELAGTTGIHEATLRKRVGEALDEMSADLVRLHSSFDPAVELIDVPLEDHFPLPVHWVPYFNHYRKMALAASGLARAVRVFVGPEIPASEVEMEMFGGRPERDPDRMLTSVIWDYARLDAAILRYNEEFDMAKIVLPDVRLAEGAGSKVLSVSRLMRWDYEDWWYKTSGTFRAHATLQELASEEDFHQVHRTLSVHENALLLKKYFARWLASCREQKEGRSVGDDVLSDWRRIAVPISLRLQQQTAAEIELHDDCVVHLAMKAWLEFCDVITEQQRQAIIEFHTPEKIRGTLLRND